MQFHFQCPVMWGGRQAGEIEMLAELSGSPDDPNIDALYAYEFAPGSPRYEIERETPEFHIAAHYLLSNPQERGLIVDKWPADERPRRSAVHEHSTHWGPL